MRDSRKLKESTSLAKSPHIKTILVSNDALKNFDNSLSRSTTLRVNEKERRIRIERSLMLRNKSGQVRKQIKNFNFNEFIDIDAFRIDYAYNSLKQALKGYNCIFLLEILFFDVHLTFKYLMVFYQQAYLFLLYC